MTAKWPSSCLHAVSIYRTPHGTFHSVTIVRANGAIRRYAQQQRLDKPDQATSRAIANTYSAQAALKAVQSHEGCDPINPPRSTRPPPLEVPERSKAQTTFHYWWSIGRAYGTFYKEGIKAVWYNNKAARALRDQIGAEYGVGKESEAAAKGAITRSEWQLLQRNNHDIGKLPLFGLMVLLFGEWLPLIVPFVPSVVPGTCRIPKQIRGMRIKAEQRRSVSFRQGIEEPTTLPVDDTKSWPMTEASYVKSLLGSLRNDQLLHLSASLGLHSSMWDRLQLPSPAFLLRRRLTQQLQYLAVDDRLLSSTEHSPRQLSSPELERACEERGIDVSGRREELLQDTLNWWLRRQKDDRGRGRAMMAMLFRRPNSWKPVSKSRF